METSRLRSGQRQDGSDARVALVVWRLAREAVPCCPAGGRLTGPVLAVETNAGPMQVPLTMDASP